jgi:hypothetical protein
MDAWLSHRLGLKLVHDVNVATIDIVSVSAELAGAFQTLQRIQAVRDNAKSPSYTNLPAHTFHYGGKWHAVRGAKVLVFRKRMNQQHFGFKRSDCLEISLAGVSTKWYAAVGLIRKGTYVIVADPTRNHHSANFGSPEVTGLRKTGRNLEAVVEELKQLTEPASSRGRRRRTAWTPPSAPSQRVQSVQRRVEVAYDAYDSYDDGDYERAKELGMSYEEYLDSHEHYEYLTAGVDDCVLAGAEGGWGSD